MQGARSEESAVAVGSWGESRRTVSVGWWLYSVPVDPCCSSVKLHLFLPSPPLHTPVGDEG